MNRYLRSKKGESGDKLGKAPFGTKEAKRQSQQALITQYNNTVLTGTNSTGISLNNPNSQSYSLRAGSILLTYILRRSGVVVADV